MLVYWNGMPLKLINARDVVSFSIRILLRRAHTQSQHTHTHKQNLVCLQTHVVPIPLVFYFNVKTYLSVGKCLSMHQPWASLLVMGIKKYYKCYLSFLLPHVHMLQARGSSVVHATQRKAVDCFNKTRTFSR